jgi:large subunit ribosomal protein L3
MKFIIGKKISMTQVFLPSGEVVPVTRVKAGPCVIVQVKNSPKENANAIEIGFEETKEFRLNQPKAGHLKDLKPLRHLRSFRVEKTDGVNRGDEIAADTFTVGDKVTIEGVSKGRGFAGVVKRHHFAGGSTSHGHKHDLRAPGSIGAGGVQRVFKGMRMAGRMGGCPVTVKNLEVMEVHPETNELYIKGAVPGARNGLVTIVGSGDLKITKTAAAEEAITASEATPSVPVEAVAAEVQPAVEIKAE